MRCTICNSVSDGALESETSPYSAKKFHPDHIGFLCDDCFVSIDEVRSEFDQDTEVNADEEFLDNVISDAIDSLFEATIIDLNEKRQERAAI